MCLGHGLEAMLLRDEIAEELLAEEGTGRPSFERSDIEPDPDSDPDADSGPPSFANESRETDIELLTDEN